MCAGVIILKGGAFGGGALGEMSTTWPSTFALATGCAAVAAGVSNATMVLMTRGEHLGKAFVL